jgi:hypothetical protein
VRRGRVSGVLDQEPAVLEADHPELRDLPTSDAVRALELRRGQRPEHLGVIARRVTNDQLLTVRRVAQRVELARRDAGRQRIGGCFRRADPARRDRRHRNREANQPQRA